MDKWVHAGVTLHLAEPDTMGWEWIGRPELQKQLMAAWMVLGDDDVPMAPRLIGRPGVGKTTLAAATARVLDAPLYIMQATADTRPEDLLINAVLDEGQRLRYAASPLVTAMLRGGVCVLDEGNRMPEKSWASLAPLLDARRYVESTLAGIKVPAAPSFRLCVTMNQDASTFDLPGYIHSRLAPELLVDYPPADEERAILEAALPVAGARLLDYVAAFLRRAHEAEAPYATRDGINIARYALRLTADAEAPDAEQIRAAVELATRQTLGPEALAHVPRETPPHDPA